MDLKSLLQPGGRPFAIVPYLVGYCFVGVSGPLLEALQYQEYLFGLSSTLFAVYTPFILLALGYALLAAFGPRVPAWPALAFVVVVGTVLSYALALHIAERWFGIDVTWGKGYWYALGYARGPMLWMGLGAAAWYLVKRGEVHARLVAQAELDRDELRASTAEARLQALQAQVEPHFLFNTLAHVKWLYRRDRGQGRRMLERFRDYVKAALPRVRQPTATLGEELELARAYLDLQQLRIGGRLAFTIDVPKEVQPLRFPPLMLITLVENAIKHGIAPQLEGGTIAIRARADRDVLRLEVSDTGAGLRHSAGTGMGLANVRARLAALFGAGARLVIEPNRPSGVVAAIEIPR